MGKTFTVEIVTPDKIAFSGEAESLVVCAEEGYLGVLAGRAPLLCTIRPGEVVLRGEGKTERFACSGGFMEAIPKKTVLLVESIERRGEIDKERAEKALQRARERLAAKPPGVDVARAQAALARAMNRLRLAGK